MALSNHECVGVIKVPDFGRFLIDERVVVENVPIISCAGCGDWATPSEHFKEVGKLARQLGMRQSVTRVNGGAPGASLIVDFASLPFAKTDR